MKVDVSVHARSLEDAPGLVMHVRPLPLPTGPKMPNVAAEPDLGTEPATHEAEPAYGRFGGGHGSQGRRTALRDTKPTRSGSSPAFALLSSSPIS